jgi:radical SAM-linked protein
MRGGAGFPVRIRFTKRGPVRFISHRDVARAFERAFRIVELPLAFTQGFAPRPKVGFGLALSVGHESDAEYLDVELTDDPGLDGLSAALGDALPQGMAVTGATALEDRAPSLQESVTLVGYDVTVTNRAPRPSADAVAAALTRTRECAVIEVTRTRKGREVAEDVRPALRRVELLAADTASAVLRCELATQPRSARPGDLLAAVNSVADATGAALADPRVLRTHQWIERGGARLEPLEADPRARVPEVRAS